MNKEKFNELLEKYKSGGISQSEYRIFLDLLKKSEGIVEMEQLLSSSWHKMELEDKSKTPEIKASVIHALNYRNIYVGVAVVVLLIIGGFFYQFFPSHIFTNQSVVFQTGYGERKEIELNDGSIVTLNANSRLTWEEGWKQEGIRTGILEGEAFFEVKSQEGIKFMVKTKDMNIEVVGTSFNVDNREDQTKVYLEEGRVNLHIVDNTLSKSESTSLRMEKEIRMNPGEVVKYDSKKDKIQKEAGQSMISAASWKQNILNFKNMKFSEVLNLLRDIYGQSFECSNSKLLNTPMYLGVPYSDWNAVRQALELSLNIEFKKTANRRYVVINTN